VPANAFLAGVVAGLALATTPTPPRHRLTAPHRRGLMPALPGIGLAIACTVALGFMARDAFSDATIRQMRLALVGETATAIPPKDQAAAEEMEEAIAAGELAYRYDPSNPRLALLISRLHLHLATVAPASDASLTHLAESRVWRIKASRNCPACRGMPEPAPASAPRLPKNRIP
jgi:hypothetical protein